MLDNKPKKRNLKNTAPEPPPTAQEQYRYNHEPSSEEVYQATMTQLMRKRASRVVALLTILALLVVARVAWLKGGPDAESLSAKAQQYSFRNVKVTAPRGDILSDDYRVLTTSVSYYELRMDLNARGLSDSLFDNNVDQLSRELSEFLKDRTAQEYRDRLIEARKKRVGYFRLSFKKVNYLELREIRKFALLNLPANVGGFIPQEMNMRVNPYGSLASRTLGFINRNGVRVGVEGAFDQYLRGKDGAMKMQKISGDFWIPVTSEFNIDPVNGSDVVTTIDVDIQDIVQRALVEQVESVEADWGCAMVMEVETGYIKAMANITRDQNNDMYEDYNYAIGMSLDPGSTFKLPVLMALLEDGGYSLSSGVDAGGGKEQVGFATVRDTKIGGYGKLNLQEAFEHSSNIGLAKLVTERYQNNPTRFLDYLKSIGIGERLGVQINGEAEPIINSPGKDGWDGSTITMMSFGYALRLAPVHTLALYNAVANGGDFMRPTLVKEILHDGEMIQQFAPDTMISQIASQKTLSDVHRALVGVVDNGTGKMLKNDRYSVAAKTGTAQIAMDKKGYGNDRSDRHYLGSIAGYFPADNPKYSVIVVLKTFVKYGERKAYYGAALAGAPFQTILEQIFNHDIQLQSRNERESSDRTTPLVVSRGSQQRLDGLKQSLNIRQTSLKSQTQLSESQRGLLDSLGIPDLRGYALTDALPVLYKKGYKVEIEGRGEVDQVVVDSDSVGQRIILKLK